MLGVSWIEPDSLPGAPTYNTVRFLSPIGPLQITSDTPVRGFEAVPDGTLLPDQVFLFASTGSGPLAEQFIDLGDTVPDSSSTLTLLGGALTLVGAVGRKLGK